MSESNVEQVRAYIANQEEHHRKMSYQDEFRALCSRHGIEIDERYVWDCSAVAPRWGFVLFVRDTQGGARASLALGWLVQSRWPEDNFV